MRRSSRQRSVTWLLPPPLGRRGEECARRGRLEMISFWLLCWKLLRATAGFRRTLPEHTDENHHNNPSCNKNLSSDSPTLAHPQNPVVMEISPLCTVTDLEKDNLFSCDSQESQELPNQDVQVVEEAAKDENEKRDECDYLVFETKVEREAQEDSEREEEDGSRGEIEREYERRREVGGEEDGKGKVHRDIQQRRETEMEVEQRRKVEEEGKKKEELETDDLGKRQIEGEDEDREGTNEAKICITGILGEMKQDASSDQIFISEDSQGLLSKPPVITSDPPASTLQEAWSHDLDNRDDVSDGHLSDCLQADLAVVYSDSDAGEDQWPALASCDETDHSKGNRANAADTCNAESMKENGRMEEIQTGVRMFKEGEMDEQKEKKSGVMEGSEEQMNSRRDIFLRSPSVSSTASSTDPDRRVPSDLCVQQESLSENVSIEHVDFLVARQQWRKMEEEVKGLPIPKPGLGAKGSFQGTHSSLYPPTRSPRLKHREIQSPMSKEPPLSSTLSPGSEDSGLDDSSFRSPPEEPESAVEREIRLTLEREEQHRQERRMIAQGLTVPRISTLGTRQPVSRSTVCRTPTLSISPSPFCSSSLNRSLYHEMTANNVIILEPDASGSSSRNRLLSSTIGSLSDWSASLDRAASASVIVVETSNLIIRSASEFCLSSGPPPVETQESTFSSNPFFKLRSISSQSLVEQEIKIVKQREEEWRRQREEIWSRKREEEWWRGRERYDTVLVSPSLNKNITFGVPVVPVRSVSSPSSPSRSRKMDRSSLSYDHKCHIVRMPWRSAGRPHF
ncbi:uncharacterized protein LOC124869767 isoform X5 [Girardinichthys multiradiatus]|uniref:uncharacterized protein LOC124869767 isoform X5 n=1 Tax=Girardinichthys multiradiatus TaxID=208333 RepID=UPI001FADDC7E|nr:uncharacterized protein LOC124869767 isoform X5 [Girardinichthys multiradiatus]